MRALIPFNHKSTDLLDTNLDDFGNMLEDFFTERWPFRRSFLGDTFKIDVQDKGNEYIIDAELPGINKDEVTVEVEEGRLKISVHKEEKTEEKDKNYIHRERRTTSMERNISLDGAKSEGINAKLENGVLKIKVPKEEKSKNSVSVKVEQKSFKSKFKNHIEK